MKVEKVTDLPKTDLWIVEKSNATKKPENLDTKNIDADDIHESDSSDGDDDDDVESYADVPQAKKIKLSTT